MKKIKIILKNINDQILDIQKIGTLNMKLGGPQNNSIVCLYNFDFIFSKKFIVETSCKETKKYFKQTWQENMGKTQEPIIKANKDEDFTCVTFYPDLSKFGMDELEDDTIALLARRAYDIAGNKNIYTLIKKSNELIN